MSQMAAPSLEIFRYIDDLDCFVVSERYREIADILGLTEWNPVVRVGRLSILDYDYGEHWFDNWDLREQLEVEAEKQGISSDDMLIIDPARFQNGANCPCHSPEMRKQFWTDVLKSLKLSYDLIFDEARSMNANHKELMLDMFIEDLEERIERLRREI